PYARTAGAQPRHGRATAIAPDRPHRAQGVVPVGVDIRDLHDTSLEHRASRNAPSTGRGRIGASVDLEDLGGEAMVSHEVKELAFEPVDEAVLGLTEPRRTLGDHVEHR